MEATIAKCLESIEFGEPQQHENMTVSSRCIALIGQDAFWRLAGGRTGPLKTAMEYCDRFIAKDGGS